MGFTVLFSQTALDHSDKDLENHFTVEENSVGVYRV